MRRSYSMIAAGAAAILGVLVGNPTRAQEKISLSIAHIATLNVPNLAVTVGALRTALEATGKVDVTLYGQGSSYSDPTKFSDLVRRGVVDIAFGSPQFEPGRYPLNTLIGEPFIAKDHITATRALWTVFKQDPRLQNEFKQIRVMLLFCSSPEQFHGVVPLRTIDDLKGVRVMTTNVGIMGIVQAVGGSVVVFPTSAQYEQLQKGVVGASSNSWTGVYVFGTNEVTTSHLNVNSVMTPNYLLINEQKYASLPPEVKKVIDDFSTAEAAIRFAEAWTTTDKLGREGAAKKNASIVTMTEDQRAATYARFKHLTDARLHDLDAKGIPATEIFQKLTAEIAVQAAKQ
jgi:TRAP-type C4-dicarboxylate transport system substrate-binding protein